MGKSLRSSGSRQTERGAVLALTAISMLVLILALGLCADISHFYSVQTELQNAADASALAGASALNNTSGGILLARTTAVAQMNNYEFNHSSINFTESNLYFATNFDSLQTFLYSNSTCADISATATPADVELAGETKLDPQQVAFVGVCMPAPANTTIFFSMTAISSPVLIRGRAIAGNSPPLTGVCDQLAPMVILDDVNTPNSTEFPPGVTMTLRNAPADPYSPGNYGLVELCGPGGADVRDALQGNCAGCVSIGSIVHPKTGVTAGPVREGWNDRFDSDVVTTQNITYNTYQQQFKDYTDTGTVPAGATINASGSYGRRVILVPSVNKDDVIGCTGSGCDWHVTSFLEFFIQAHVPGGNGGEIKAEFIDKINVANGTYGGGPAVPSLTRTVLYR